MSLFSSVINQLAEIQATIGDEFSSYRGLCGGCRKIQNGIWDRASCIAVKKAVHSGHVADAVEKINDLNPEILDAHLQLFFHLQQQRLIELIRNGKVDEALESAQEELAPRGEENQSFLEELERTVVLLAFKDVTRCPVGELLDVSQRMKTASEVNAAILTSQSHEKDPKLPSLLKMLIWAQNQLDEKTVYPRISDLCTAALEDPAFSKPRTVPRTSR